MDAQRVNIGLHHLSQRVEDHTVASERCFAGEGSRNDRYVEMTAAISRALMASVQMTLVLHEQVLRQERLGEQGLNACDSVCSHGSTRLNGFTTTFS